MNSQHAAAKTRNSQIRFNNLTFSNIEVGNGASNPNTQRERERESVGKDFCIDSAIWDFFYILSLAAKSENYAWQGEDSGFESVQLVGT